jgi:cysteine desulfurase
MDGRTYMDNAAATRLSEKALNAMLPFFREEYGNPSAIHSHGIAAKNALEEARRRVAKALGALNTEIFFTSGGTESDNWAIRSVLETKGSKGKHIVSSAFEHNAVLKTLEKLETEGFEVTLLKPDKRGRITAEALDAAIRPDTVLATLMMANNVVGTILPVKAFAEVARAKGVTFHTDAVQAVGHLPVKVRDLDVDLLSLSAHKFHGPKGVGVLYSKIPRLPAPLLAGGGQERGGRSGTENVAGAVGLSVALEECVENLPARTERLTSMRDRLVKGILELPGARLTGDPENRLPGHASFVFDGIKHSVFVVNGLNDLGVSVSSGAACSASSQEASHVLAAMGHDKGETHKALRITLSVENTPVEVEEVIEKVVRVVSNERGRPEIVTMF